MGNCISMNLMALRVSPSPELCPLKQQSKCYSISVPPLQVQLLVQDRLHSGSKADIYVVMSQAPNVLHGTLLAVKIIRDKTCMLPVKLSEESILEAYASRSRRLSHPNVDAILLASSKTDRSPYIVSKYYSRGSFLVDLKARSRTDQQRLAMIKGLVNGLHYIHRQGIMHGHICEANLLCDDNGEVVICDAEFDDTFGLFASSCEMQVAMHRSYRHMPHERLISDNDAPLLPASKAADIYAIAVCITQMWTLDVPFARKNKFEVMIMLRKLRNLEIEIERPASVPAAVWDNISDCFAVDPRDRPTAGDFKEQFEECAVLPERRVGE